MGFIAGMQECFNICRSINAIHHIKNRRIKLTWSFKELHEKHLTRLNTFVMDEEGMEMSMIEAVHTAPPQFTSYSTGKFLVIL